VPAFERFVADYDAAGIEDQPPDAVRALAAGADRLVASDLRRAVESAERVSGGRQFETTPLLRECPVAMPRVRVPLPVDVWDAIGNALWVARRLTGADAQGVLSRAESAADWLVERAGAARSLFVVTHGTFRLMLSRALARRGIALTAGGIDLRNWSVWSHRTCLHA